MKKIFLLLILFPLLIMGPVYAQGGEWINVDEARVEQGFVVLEYEITFGGMVEVRLFDEEGLLVYRNQMIEEPGKGAVRLKSSGFENGKKYILQLNYKREEIKRSVVIGS